MVLTFIFFNSSTLVRRILISNRKTPLNPPIAMAGVSVTTASVVRKAYGKQVKLNVLCEPFPVRILSVIDPICVEGM